MTTQAETAVELAGEEDLRAPAVSNGAHERQ